MNSSSDISGDRHQAADTPRPVLILSLVAITLIGGLPIMGVDVKPWIQPSLIGLIWGGLFLSGFGLASTAPQSLVQLLALTSCAWILTLAFRFITDLSIEECIIVSVSLFATGWLARRFDRRMLKVVSEVQLPAKWQVPLLDFFIATTLVACLSRAFVNMSSAPVMLISVLGTLLVGCSCCWAAYHWAWNDSQPVGVPLVVVALLALVGIGISAKISPLTPIELAAWLLVGPLSVLAAQSFTVLGVFAVIRWQAKSLLAS